MLSKNKANYIVSLQNKKAREKEKCYVIEGDKIVREFLQTKAPVNMLIGKPEFLDSLASNITSSIDDIIPVSYEELKRISSLKTPHNALAVVKMPSQIHTPSVNGKLVAALDFVQDPGNLGTIIRAAAWFGISDIFCSDNCVDVYNPKVIQASMGAMLHVDIHYTNLIELFKSSLNIKCKIYGTSLKGQSIYNHELTKEGIILLGNESRGISNELLPYITDFIKIPRIGKSEAPGIDSLNVSMAASVIFSEFARR